MWWGAELQQRRRAGGVHGQRPPAAYLQLAALLWRAEGQQQPYRRHLGGVRADGGGLSLSYDRGEAHGIWSSLGADSLTGKNVADNWRVRWMTGYYYKVINENNRRVTVGLNNMIWHYDKDLSGYTLGQGGYYSPQEYLSFAVPVTWRQRTENWSWSSAGRCHGPIRAPRRKPAIRC